MSANRWLSLISILVFLAIWEVSLVTFPMLPDARVGAKGDDPDGAAIRDLTAAINAARASMQTMTG